MSISLADLVAGSEPLASVSRDQIPGLLGQLAKLQAELNAKLVEPIQPTADGSPADQLLDVNEVADALGVTARWVYRQHGRGMLPFAVPLGANTLRFSERRMWEFVANRCRNRECGGVLGTPGALSASGP